MKTKNTNDVLRYKTIFMMIFVIGTILGFLLCQLIPIPEKDPRPMICFLLMSIVICLFPVSIWLAAGRKTSCVMSFITGVSIGICLHSLGIPIEDEGMNYRFLMLILTPTFVSFVFNSDPEFKGVMNV